MNNWSVRARIVAAFATIILIMAVLAAVSLVQLRDIRQQATLLRGDVLPGVLLAAEMSGHAQNLLPAVINEASGTDLQVKARARTDLEEAISAVRKEASMSKTLSLSIREETGHSSGMTGETPLCQRQRNSLITS